MTQYHFGTDIPIPSQDKVDAAMSDNRPWGINTLSSMIGSKHTSAGTSSGPWYRSVPMPYHTLGMQRVRAAWWVLTGRAHAVVWPMHGDLEKALER